MLHGNEKSLPVQASVAALTGESRCPYKREALHEQPEVYYSGCPFLLNFILTFPPGVERQKGLMEKRKVLGP